MFLEIQYQHFFSFWCHSYKIHWCWLLFSWVFCLLFYSFLQYPLFIILLTPGFYFANNKIGNLPKSSSESVHPFRAPMAISIATRKSLINKRPKTETSLLFYVIINTVWNHTVRTSSCFFTKPTQPQLSPNNNNNEYAFNRHAFSFITIVFLKFLKKGRIFFGL